VSIVKRLIRLIKAGFVVRKLMQQNKKTSLEKKKNFWEKKRKKGHPRLATKENCHHVSWVQNFIWKGNKK